MRRSKVNSVMRPSTSPSQCATVHEEEIQIPRITRTSYCLVDQPSVPRPRAAVPLETPAKLQKRHTFVEVTRRKSQKEQIQPRPGTYVEQANENTPAPGPTRTSVLQLPSYKRSSLWISRKTKLLGASTTDNAAPSLPVRRDAVAQSPSPLTPVLRIGSPMVLMPMDVHRRRTIQRKSIVQGPWQSHPVVPSSSSPSVAPEGDKVNSRPTAPQKRILHRRSSHLYSSSIAASLSMYGQSSRSQQTLQRPVSKVLEETDLDIIKVEHDLDDVSRDSMTPSMESGWTAASYQSTAECVWKDTQWDFVPPPTTSGIEPKWMRFLELEDEGDLAAFSESFEVTLPYLDSSCSTPTTTTPTSATYRPDSPTLTLTSDALPPPPPFQDDTLKRNYREERDSLLVLDYDYTAAIDQIVHGDHDHYNDDTDSLELGPTVVPGPTPSSHPQQPPEQQRPSFRPGHRARSSLSSFKTISRRAPSIKRGHGHRLSTTQRKDFLVEKGTGAPAVSVRRRSLTKSRRPNGAVRRSVRPAMPGGFDLDAVAPMSLAKSAPVISSSRVSSPSPAPTLPCVYGQSAARRSQASSVGSVPVETAKAQTATPGATHEHNGVTGRFGRLGARGEEHIPSAPKVKSKPKKSIFFNVVQFFAKG